VYQYTIRVIKTFRHAGVEKFYHSGSKAGIQAAHATKLRRQLALLDASISAQEMDVPGWHLHPLKGTLKDHWSVRVSGNWRMTFKFEGEDAVLVDYQDYH
jgi:toxin HigB-1